MIILSKMKLQVYACLEGRYNYGCEKPEVKRGCGIAMDFLCKIEVSRFIPCLSLVKHYFTLESLGF